MAVVLGGSEGNRVRGGKQWTRSLAQNIETVKKTPVPGGPKSGYRYLCIILIISDFQDSFTGRLASKFPMKKSAQRNCSKAEPKIFAPSQTPFSGGRGTAKIQSAGDGHYFYLQTQFGEDRCTQFRVIVVKDPPTQKHTQTDGTDYNTLRRS